MNRIKEYLQSLQLERVLPVAAILIVGVIVVKLLLKLFDRALRRSKLNKSMFSFLKTLMRILLYAIVILIAVSYLGIDVTSLVAVLSVISLAVSLAVQNTLANVVGSVSLLATQPFNVGDFVQIGTDSGIVQEISMSYTRMLTLDGKTIYIPNSDAAAARICNYSVEGKRRVELCFTAAYDDDIDKVKAAILTATSHPKLLSDPAPQVYVNNYLDSAIEYQLFAWTSANDYFEVKMAINEAVKKEFDRQNISIPFPQVDVHVQSNT